MLIVMACIFSVTFYFGVFANPQCSIYDFCMNLASEILGLVIAIVIVDTYISEKGRTRSGQMRRALFLPPVEV